MKQLLVSILWISIGFGGIAFSLREWNLSLRQSDDWLANIQPIVHITARVVGWTFVCIGVIALVATRRRTKVLIVALCGAIFGLFVGAMAYRPSSRIGHTTAGEAFVYVVMALGSLLFLIVHAVVVNTTSEPEKYPDQSDPPSVRSGWQFRLGLTMIDAFAARLVIPPQRCPRV